MRLVLNFEPLFRPFIMLWLLISMKNAWAEVIGSLAIGFTVGYFVFAGG